MTHVHVFETVPEAYEYACEAARRLFGDGLGEATLRGVLRLNKSYVWTLCFSRSSYEKNPEIYQRADVVFSHVGKKTTVIKLNPKKGGR